MHEATCLDQFGLHLALCEQPGGGSPAEARGRRDVGNFICIAVPKRSGGGQAAPEPAPVVVRAEVDLADPALAEDTVAAVLNPDADGVEP
jgi:hypothetical protein